MRIIHFILAALCVVWPSQVMAQDQGGPLIPDIIMTNADGRQGIDLSGEWHYSIDPYRDGLYGFHGAPAGSGHQRFDPVNVDAVTAQNPTRLYEYDMRQSPKTTLPGSWTGHAPEMRHYEGLVWYAKEVDVTPEDGERFFLHLDGVNYTARVYMNGELLGVHEGGFTPFTFEATDAMVSGTNYVAIGVDSVRTPDSIPPKVTDWETYGGITRGIKLIRTPETFIDDYWVRLTPEGKIKANIKINGPDAANRSVAVEIHDLRKRLRVRTDENGYASVEDEAPRDLCLWSPDLPCRHNVMVKLFDESISEDDYHILPHRVWEPIGFRTIETDGADILLNGKPIFLRGISMHEEELGDNPARNMTEDNARALLTEIKEGLNGNFVRLAHYPHTESTLRLADEIGLLVWSEIPVYWRVKWDNPKTMETARRMLAENITRDRNRASVVIWSVGNETPESESRNTFMEQLVGDVRAMDDTRLVSAALLTAWSNDEGVLTSRINDPLAAHLDVLSVNAYAGWYGPTPLNEVHAIEWPDDFGKPMVFSEFGAGAFIGFSEPDLMRKFSVEYQAEYYRQTLAMAERIPHLRGTSPWILKDFRSPRRQHPVYQEGWNRKGLITETGERKPAFDVLADFYADKAAED